MKGLKSVLLWIISGIAIVVLTILFFILINAFQASIFLPKEYLMWTFKPPFSRFVLIFELYSAIGIFSIVHKGFRRSLSHFFKKSRKTFIPIFILFNLVWLYTIVTAVTVITKNKIIDYSFLSPQGRKFGYQDIVKINAGVYGKKTYIPFSSHSKGDFYYIFELKDGTKIDLAEMGGSKNDVDPRFIIEKLDKQFVHMGISKTSSMKNFKLATKQLDKIYTDKIRNILENNK